MDIRSTVRLNDRTELPVVGFGTYRLQGPEGVKAIVRAVETGYRLLDSAVNYENETEVGQAVRQSGIADELLVTTKVPGRDHGYEQTLASARGSLSRLGTDRLDLYLIHWPNPSVGKYVETWRALIKLRDDGLVRSIGVCNFTEAMLDQVIEETGVTPAVNQVELHPYFPQADLRAFHARAGIRTESWSPLARARELLDERPIVEAARTHGVTGAQVVLRWHLQLDSTAIPKSSSAERQRTNADIFGFELTEDEMVAISGLERGRLWGADPDTHEEM